MAEILIIRFQRVLGKYRAAPIRGRNESMGRQVSIKICLGRVKEDSLKRRMCAYVKDCKNTIFQNFLLHI